MITIKHVGNFEKTDRFLKKMSHFEVRRFLKECGEEGVAALQAATPKASGKTAESWRYEIEQHRESASITWYNSNVNEGVNIAIILQYGHGTGTGGYVKGIDYINPALQPVFDRLAENLWKEVSNA